MDQNLELDVHVKEEEEFKISESTVDNPNLNVKSSILISTPENDTSLGVGDFN